MQYLCDFRLQIATDRINGNLSIAEIASEAGFNDYCYFSRSFKKYIGVTPAKYFGKWSKEDPRTE